MFFLHRSGASLLPHALLKAVREVIDLFIGEMSYMPDAECRLLDLSQAFADLDTELLVHTPSESFDVKTRRRYDTGDTVARPPGIDLHVRLPNKGANAIRHLRPSRIKLLFALSMDVVQRRIELEEQRERRREGNRSLVLGPVPVESRSFGSGLFLPGPRANGDNTE